MKKLLLLLIIPFISFGQNNYSTHSNLNDKISTQNILGCEDADDTILNILSLFINDPEFGFFGCSDVIPYLESQVLIPLNCNTSLTPFGYFNMTVSDICECSCQEYLDIDVTDLSNKKIIKMFSIIGQQSIQTGFQLHIYDDGSVEKKYLIK